MSEKTFTSRLAAVRRFNRFYTRQIGILNDGLLQSPFSLTEVRVLYELAHREGLTAKDLATGLSADAGYMSRILQRLRIERLITQKASPRDGRQRLLSLTAIGRRTFATLDVRASEEIRGMLAHVSEDDQRRMVQAMDSIQSILEGRRPNRVPYLLRPHQPGDMGWVVQRHGILYAQEYGWNAEFEALVAKIASAFLGRFDAHRERCWIAEREGEPVGSVFLVEKSKTVAQLRLLLVEPSARGLGIGRRLVEECDRFARQARYQKIVLWTQSVLHAAHAIYQQAGYRLVNEEPHHSFGQDLIGQTWEKSLRPVD